MAELSAEYVAPKMLTLWQPWASLIAVGEKWIETRSWSTPYRGALAIHAASRERRVSKFGAVPDGAVTAADEYTHDHGICCCGHDALKCLRFGLCSLPLGAVVATADLVDVVPMVSWTGALDGPAVWAARLRTDEGSTEAVLLRDQVNADESIERVGPLPDSIDVTDQIPFGDFRPGRFAWLLDNVRALPEPITARGHRGLRDCPVAVV